MDKVTHTPVAPGCTRIEVERAFALQDGSVRVTCEWSEEDGVWLARLGDAHPPPHITFAVTGAGDTKDAALAHLAIAFYVCAIPEPDRDG